MAQGNSRLDNYVEVKDRLIQFHQKFPDGRITTELISWEKGIVLVKVAIYRNGEDQYRELPSSTGYAYEREDPKNKINITSILENCETSAVGRALANLNFSPFREIVQLTNNLKDYVSVNERIQEFYQRCEDGRIITELISWENDIVMFKSFTYRNAEDQYKGLPSSTGMAYEREGVGPVNKKNVIENCETSAVGRALANLGLKIKKSIASREEMEVALAAQEQLEKRGGGEKLKVNTVQKKQTPLQQLINEVNKVAKTPEQKFNLKNELIQAVGEFASLDKMNQEQIQKALDYMKKK
jgi:glutaredoxin-related protein